MDNERPVRKMYKWKPLGTRKAGRNTVGGRCCEGLQLLNMKNWTKRIQNTEEWRRTVEKVKTFKE
jgi:hypothetical protein